MILILVSFHQMFEPTSQSSISNVNVTYLSLRVKLLSIFILNAFTLPAEFRWTCDKFGFWLSKTVSNNPFGMRERIETLGEQACAKSCIRINFTLLSKFVISVILYKV